MLLCENLILRLPSFISISFRQFYYSLEYFETVYQSEGVTENKDYELRILLCFFLTFSQWSLSWHVSSITNILYMRYADHVYFLIVNNFRFLQNFFLERLRLPFPSLFLFAYILQAFVWPYHTKLCSWYTDYGVSKFLKSLWDRISVYGVLEFLKSLWDRRISKIKSNWWQVNKSSLSVAAGWGTRLTPKIRSLVNWSPPIWTLKPSKFKLAFL